MEYAADPALWEESLKHEHQVPCVQGTMAHMGEGRKAPPLCQAEDVHTGRRGCCLQEARLWRRRGLYK